MKELPIRKLTLYKQGIGYFERQGEFLGNHISLIIPRENINDILKSLHVSDKNGGQVLGVDYETPADKETVLQDLSIKLREQTTMVDLLQSLRGSRVKLIMIDGSSVNGRLVGVDTSLYHHASQSAKALLQSEQNRDDIEIYALTDIQTISLQDDHATADLSFLLDVSQTEENKAAVTIRLSEGEHNLELAYLAPSPTWRVRYQLVSDGDNQARLIGWGIFDNILDEDLEDVALTLISGRPISFEYGLYETYTPSRPKVSDDPMDSDESVRSSPEYRNMISSISHELRTPLNSILGYTRLLQQGMAGELTDQQKEMIEPIGKGSQRVLEMINELLEMSKLSDGRQNRLDYGNMYRYGAGPLGDLKVSNAYFMPMVIGNAEPDYLTYSVDTPVSVRRKQSAMVPIIDYQIEYQEICVYNGAKMPNHPLLVWELKNDTGKALEQGPVTLQVQDKYLGEGLVRFAGVGDPLQIPYALQFGIIVSEKTESRNSHGVLELTFDAKKQSANLKRYNITHYIYTLTSRVAKEHTVYIERRDPNRGSYFEMEEPTFQAGGHSRWAVNVTGNSETSFTVKERATYERTEDIKTWTREFVDLLKDKGLAGAKVYAKFEAYWSELGEEERISKVRESLNQEYQQLLARQQQLRQNLGALGKSAREDDIRNQILDDLEASENRRRQLETEMSQIEQQIKELKLAQESLIEEIYSMDAAM